MNLEQTHIRTNKRNAIIVGLLFLIAMVSSLLGAVLVEGILGTPEYLKSAHEHAVQIYAGVYLELLNGIAVVGIAVMMFRILKLHQETIAIGYVGFRILESISCIAAAMFPLLILSLSREYGAAGPTEISSFQTSGTVILAARGHVAGILVPVFFSLSAIMFYHTLYVTKLLSRFISIWGLLGVALMITLNLCKIENSMGMLLVLPLILNEIFLGIWLIIKGFNSEALVSISSG